MTEPVLLIGAFLVGLLAFANGSNDVSKGIATLVGSGVSDTRTALRWGTAWTFAGGLLGLFFSLALVKTFTKGILAVPLESMSPAVPLAVMIGTTAWVLTASRISMPVSTT
ncbi:MAG TPA: inorganic phosphate transporter, partial [Nitrospiria bacterium]|nr:inorganic phosphate transporter [Nitrospiria bacterium]